MRRRRDRLRAAASKLWQGIGLRPIIGVTGSGTVDEVRLATALGAWCANSGYHLLTGGGKGVMTSVSRAFAEAREQLEGDKDCGLILSVLPGLPAGRAQDWAQAREEVSSKLLVDQSSGKLQYSVMLGAEDEPEETIVPPEGYPNAFVDVAVQTHLPSSGGAGQSMLSRSHIPVLSSDVMVALPGGRGTASEVELAIHYGIPVCRFLGSSGIIPGLTERADAKAPVCEDIAAVQNFARRALTTRRQKAPPAAKMARRQSLERLPSKEDSIAEGIPEK